MAMCTSFMSTLLPLIYFSHRLIRSKADSEIDEIIELQVNPLPNKVFGWVLAFERVLIQIGVRRAIGGSRLVIAKKPTTGDSGK